MANDVVDDDGEEFVIVVDDDNVVVVSSADFPDKFRDVSWVSDPWDEGICDPELCGEEEPYLIIEMLKCISYWMISDQKCEIVNYTKMKCTGLVTLIGGRFDERGRGEGIGSSILRNSSCNINSTPKSVLSEFFFENIHFFDCFFFRFFGVLLKIRCFSPKWASFAKERK